MDFSIETSYIQAKNIGVLRVSGSPSTKQEVDGIVNKATSIWLNDRHKVYSITDLTQMDFTKFEMLNYYQQQIMPLMKGRTALSVIVTTTATMDVLARMFNIISGSHLPVVNSMDEAMALIEKEQAISGIFPSI